MPLEKRAVANRGVNLDLEGDVFGTVSNVRQSYFKLHLEGANLGVFVGGLRNEFVSAVALFDHRDE